MFSPVCVILLDERVGPAWWWGGGGSSRPGPAGGGGGWITIVR